MCTWAEMAERSEIIDPVFYPGQLSQQGTSHLSLGEGGIELEAKGRC